MRSAARIQWSLIFLLEVYSQASSHEVLVVSSDGADFISHQVYKAWRYPAVANGQLYYRYPKMNDVESNDAFLRCSQRCYLNANCSGFSFSYYISYNICTLYADNLCFVDNRTDFMKPYGGHASVYFDKVSGNNYPCIEQCAMRHDGFCKYCGLDGCYGNQCEHCGQTCEYHHYMLQQEGYYNTTIWLTDYTTPYKQAFCWGIWTNLFTRNVLSPQDTLNLASFKRTVNSTFAVGTNPAFYPSGFYWFGLTSFKDFSVSMKGSLLVRLTDTSNQIYEAWYEGFTLGVDGTFQVQEFVGGNAGDGIGIPTSAAFVKKGALATTCGYYWNFATNVHLEELLNATPAATVSSTAESTTVPAVEAQSSTEVASSTEILSSTTQEVASTTTSQGTTTSTTETNVMTSEDTYESSPVYTEPPLDPTEESIGLSSTETSTVESTVTTRTTQEPSTSATVPTTTIDLSQICRWGTFTFGSTYAKLNWATLANVDLAAMEFFVK